MRGGWTGNARGPRGFNPLVLLIRGPGRYDGPDRLGDPSPVPDLTDLRGLASPMDPGTHSEKVGGFAPTFYEDFPDPRGRPYPKIPGPVGHTPKSRIPGAGAFPGPVGRAGRSGEPLDSPKLFWPKFFSSSVCPGVPDSPSCCTLARTLGRGRFGAIGATSRTSAIPGSGLVEHATAFSRPNTNGSRARGPEVLGSTLVWPRAGR